MTPEELQQIQAIVQAVVAPLEQGQQQLSKQVAAIEARLETKIATVETTLQSQIQANRSEVHASEQKIMEKLDKIELLAADYLDGQVQTTKRRLDRVEKILNITP